MTRLITEWIYQMEETAQSWNDQLERNTGLGFAKIAETVGTHPLGSVSAAVQTHLVAVVPITSGLGTISSFSESVAAIVRTMGFDVFVTNATDINGIYEAHCAGADIVYMADDERYIALNLAKKKMGDNNIATAKAYVEVLDKMAGDLACREVAVLGYGIIGKLMAGFLKAKGATVDVYDRDQSKKTKVLADGFGWISDRAELKKYKYIADGTSEGNWLEADLLSPEVKIAAPGVPLSLTEDAQQVLQGRFIHDFLEIGTAAMMGLVL